MAENEIFVLDYGAGNVRSVINAIQKLGFKVKFITKKSDFDTASKILFPGVGAFKSAMHKLKELDFIEPLKAYITSNRPFMGICVGMQCLYSKSTENGDCPGLDIIPATIQKFKSTSKSVPHIGWNSAIKPSTFKPQFVNENDKYYFVHSYACTTTGQESGVHMEEWANTLTTYGDETFVSSISKGTMYTNQKEISLQLNFILKRVEWLD
jgi:imidazole glycerol-phosphate synthase